MNLYYAPAACSLADHIALIEADVRFKLIRVGRDKQTEDGRDFTSINPKGYTPALELDDGTILTENLTILLYIAETTGKLLAKDGLGTVDSWDSQSCIDVIQDCRWRQSWVFLIV
jgi:glutathione S-transferase